MPEDCNGGEIKNNIDDQCQKETQEPCAPFAKQIMYVLVENARYALAVEQAKVGSRGSLVLVVCFTSYLPCGDF